MSCHKQYPQTNGANRQPVGGAKNGKLFTDAGFLIFLYLCDQDKWGESSIFWVNRQYLKANDLSCSGSRLPLWRSQLDLVPVRRFVSVGFRRQVNPSTFLPLFKLVYTKLLLSPRPGGEEHEEKNIRNNPPALPASPETRGKIKLIN